MGKIIQNIKTSEAYFDMGLHPALPEICVVSHLPASECREHISVSWQAGTEP